MSDQATTTLFCFAHAGAGASAYRTWAVSAPFRVVPVQYPGREERLAEAPVPDILKLAELAESTVLSRAGGRYALFGHSMGAMVAYELVQRLRGKDVPQPAPFSYPAVSRPIIPAGWSRFRTWTMPP